MQWAARVGAEVVREVVAPSQRQEVYVEQGQNKLVTFGRILQVGEHTGSSCPKGH